MRDLGGPVALGAVAVAAVLSLAMGSSDTERSPANRAGEQAGRLADNGATGAFRVFMDPSGTDGNDGRTPSSPVQSLAQVQRVIAAARPTSDVEVRIAKGTYVAPPLVWDTYVAGRSITFLPADYDYGEGVGGIRGRPIFRGTGSAGFWFRAVLPPQNAGGDARLRFYYLQVERYSSGGIMLDGGTKRNGAGVTLPRTLGVNGNTVYGMNFRSIGSKHVSSGLGFGALDLVNSRNNVIQRNEFTRIENRSGSGELELVHGIYMAHHSTGNVIRENRFDRVSGDPIRTRNGSGRNDIARNTFVRSGFKAFFSDWFVSALKSRETRECPSTQNKFHENRLISGYVGGVTPWSASPDGPEHSAAADCGNGAENRVLSWDNETR
ncbi:right-handed parallel beta-helix repeat-containing protein [Actinomadura sp. HBU206391]|uniref:right-handed parallel beta-helix repeat-containing protein n=1 Tax=Actinomadura sp. HBU206391 TaxID=2731692 RepID=UPI0016504FE6|nr:right-handed parallel beta-helix repeat-containing protein [Actinomadura sp. HBU206391]MBC6458773.1 right-handed parallel beta-helix repeat-containing protein [Actinomadura sp. HBU206391]